MVQIKETVDMGENGSDKIYFCRTGKSYFHTASPLSETIIFHETTKGPFLKEKTIFQSK